MSATKAIIFDIQRFSVNDGPGIRTSIFMKGCSLECFWCHNPESWNPKPELGFIEKNCTVCQNCAEVCKNHVHSFDQDKHTIDRDQCILCGQCVEVCSNNALKIYGKEYTVDEIFKIAMSDKIYYIQSGGGVTLSGGEPLQQYKFVIELFKKLKDESIHTCLDTSGFASIPVIEHIIPWTDLFLFDYKLSKEKDYCEYTKINHDTILNNLRILLQYQKPVILRCPIIPNINDNNFHLESIKSLVLNHPNIRQVDIIPYHKFGEAKYAYLATNRVHEQIDLNRIEKIEQIKKNLESALPIPIYLSRDYAH